ncbi:MAG: hypothetical protein SGJ02_02850, partial [bacterium]|nr:hypothetical protein [bacterium]
KERFEPRRGNRERKPQAYPLGYVEDFLSMTDEVAGQRSLFAVGESFATGPLCIHGATLGAITYQIALCQTLS